MNTLRHYMEQMARESSAPYLFFDPPLLRFRSPRINCPKCRAPLKVVKTRTKTLSTLHLGSFNAHETLLGCDCQNPVIYPAEALGGLVPAGCTFGYDVMSFVGKGIFLRHRRPEEMVEELRSRNVAISSSEVGYLARKFVVYLALAHRQSAPRLKKAMGEQGGYILHLDGTCEGGGPILMSSLDAISRIVLGNVKVPSEKTQQIIPLLKEIKRRYGVPLAVVHDMGKGILGAVKAVFEGIPDFICHFHFLRDIGKDLLQADYDAIRNRLRKHGVTEKLRSHARQLKGVIDAQPALVENFCQSVQGNSLPQEHLDQFPLLCAYALIQWVLAAKTQGQGYGFPFDRPHLQFAKRLGILHEQLEQMKEVHLREQWRDNLPLWKLSREIEKISADFGLRKILRSIDLKIDVFDQLRDAMRIAQHGGAAGLNSGGELIAMGPIEKALTRFRKEITSRPDYSSEQGWKAMIGQIDKYWDKLFAEPIVVQGPARRWSIQPQRTNNIMERFFRDFRRSARRRTGHNSISKLLQSMVADTPLVSNLENPQYLKVLLNGKTTLEERFAQIDADTVRTELQAAQQSPERVPVKIRQLIALPVLPQALGRLFRKVA